MISIDAYETSKLLTVRFSGSTELLNVKPVSFASVGRKKGANLGTLGASFGLFRC